MTAFLYPPTACFHSLSVLLSGSVLPSPSLPPHPSLVFSLFPLQSLALVAEATEVGVRGDGRVPVMQLNWTCALNL